MGSEQNQTQLPANLIGPNTVSVVATAHGQPNVEIWSAPDVDRNDTGTSCVGFGPNIQLAVPQSNGENLSAQTPLLEKILDAQGFDDTLKEFFCACIGRLFYPYDNLHFVPFLHGSLENGVGVISNMLSMLFCGEHVLDLSPTAPRPQDTFGRRVWVANGIDENEELPLGVLQSLVTGETIEFTFKGKPNVNIRFSGNGIMSGTALPSSYRDSGSIRRMLAFFRFKNPVSLGEDDLLSELPAIIHRCNTAYMAFVAKFPNGKFSPANDLPPATRYSALIDA